MNRKKVWRYYCEHCKKSGCSAGHLAKHERGCTANPNRSCGVCGKLDLASKPLPDLIAFVKAKATSGDSIDGNPDDSSLWLSQEATKELRELAGGCPCCMLAAARQSTVYLPSQEFNLKSELRELWSDSDHEQMRREYHYG